MGRPSFARRCVATEAAAGDGSSSSKEREARNTKTSARCGQRDLLGSKCRWWEAFIYILSLCRGDLSFEASKIPRAQHLLPVSKIDELGSLLLTT